MIESITYKIASDSIDSALGEEQWNNDEMRDAFMGRMAVLAAERLGFPVTVVANDFGNASHFTLRSDDPIEDREAHGERIEEALDSAYADAVEEMISDAR